MRSGERRALGFGARAQSEHPECFKLLDVDAPDGPVFLRALATRESQLVQRGAELSAPQLQAVVRGGGALTAPEGTASWSLQIQNRGTLDGLALRERPQTDLALQPRQARVSLRAAGLNFRDVLNALGMIPGEWPLGHEGAGIVLEVAADVTGLAPGDRVMGLLPDALARSR